jgi:hypothetical protein
MGMLELFFGKKKKCKGRKVKKGRKVRKLSSKARVMIGGKKRKVYKGCNGGLYYKRTKNGKTYRVYISPKLLRKKSSTRMGGTRFGRRGVKKGSRLKMTKAAKRARAYARKRRRCLKKGMRLKKGRCRRM